MEYGIIYIKVLPPSGHKLEWVKYCYLFDFLPKSIQQNIVKISDDINTKYVDDIVIPMDIMLHPGCTTNSDKVEEIANDMYNQFIELSNIQGFSNYIRCVYTTGQLSTINVKSTHQLKHDPVMLKLGRFLDSSDECGLFKI